MKYNSTRDKTISLSSAEAIVKGLSPDGGLFVPDSIPRLGGGEIAALSEMEYTERAKTVLGLLLTDFTAEELSSCVEAAYGGKKFETNAVAPLYKLCQDQFVLELWHGPTCAFKDMALQILPRLLSAARNKLDIQEETLILVATSGDTGKAALEGFKDVRGTKIVVFFPEEGVSAIQKLQMATQSGSNVFVSGVSGNFDDAQNGVKEIFTDRGYAAELKAKNLALSSANSINWGRLAPQIVYYFSAYCEMLGAGEIRMGEKINLCVPTGNFGNILAGYYAHMMGLPVGKLICASNQNNVLSDFLKSGIYDKNRAFFTTISPSMDILISSNLERLLYSLSGENTEEVKGYMTALSESGRYEVSDKIKREIKKMFWGGFSDDAEAKDTILRTWDEYSYVIDTHTSVAVSVYNKYRSETGDETKTVIASTASPFKFGADVLSALKGDAACEDRDEFGILEKLAADFGIKIPASLAKLKEKEVRFESVCARDQMRAAVNEFLNG